MKEQEEFAKEQQLVREISKGGVQALEEIYDRYQYEVREFSRTVLNLYNFTGTGLEDDIAQRTFIKFPDTLKNFRFESKESLRKWLFGIARNEARDEARAKNKILSIDSINLDEDNEYQIENTVISYEQDFEEEVYEGEVSEMLYKAINNLPSPYKELMLAWVETDFEASMEQLAIIFRTNEGTIKSRLRRARYLLKPLLEKLKKQAK